jgi:hypothetical protein
MGITTKLGMCCHCRFDQWRCVPCSRKAKIDRDGKPYCKQHDPVATAARRAASDAKTDAKRTAERKQRAHELACIAAMQDIPDPLAFVQTVRELVAWEFGDHDGEKDYGTVARLYARLRKALQPPTPPAAEARRTE